MRTFDTGATRNDDEERIDPEAALSPLVLEAYCTFIAKHRLQPSGELRSDDNWQKGIPLTSYMKSLCRHLLEAWKAHRGYKTKESLKDSLFAIMFNAQGMLHDILKEDLTPFIDGATDNILWRKLYSGTTPTETKPLSYLEAQQGWLKLQKSMTAYVQQPANDWSETVQGELKGLTDPQSDPKNS